MICHSDNNLPINNISPLVWALKITTMGVSNKFFLDIRQTEEYEQFDHDKRFCEKVKGNWLTTDQFRNLLSASLYELTQALIDKKLSDGYLEQIMKLIDEKEPKYLTGEEGLNYIKLISKTSLENMKRVFRKYDGIEYFIKANLRNGLELLILNHG